MKLHLPLSLRSSLMACMAFAGFTVSSVSAAAFEAKSDLGDTMFVGDSITHGQRTGLGSWRWSLSKILIDNNINFNEVGVASNSFSGDFGTNKVYGNGFFRNIHSAWSGERAFEIAGTKDAASSRLGGTGIEQWLNFDSDYTGNYHIDADVTPSTYFLLIGTNDLLSATGSHVSQGNQYQEVKDHLLGTQSGNNVWSGKGDMDIIIDTMRLKSGDDVDIVVLTLPTWNGAYGDAIQNLPEDYECVRQYNEALKDWAEWKGVKVVDINFGLVDVANTTEPWRAVPSFIADKLHPSPQGELIIAGNVARALGYAGRTAGQLRKSTADFSTIHKNTTIAVGESRSYNWGDADLSHGFTVDFTLSRGVGNGATDGWNTTGNFSVSVGDDAHYGTLNINEAYIQWGNTILFSMDTSALTDSLRIAYVYGNNAKNLSTGFYVWMDDQLIGEGLGNIGDAIDGIDITNSTSGAITLENLSWDGRGSWAPATTRLKNGNPTIAGLKSDYGEFPGKKVWANAEDLREESIAIREKISESLSDGELGCTVNSGSQGPVFGNATDRDRDLYITLSGSAGFSSFMGFHGYKTTPKINSTFAANGYLRVIDLTEEKSFAAFIATTNNNASISVDGDIYFEFSSAGVTINNGLFSNVNAAIAGVYAAPGGITGAFRIVINDGTFGNIIGGSINGNAHVGAVELFLNGGFFIGNIAAGGYFGSVGNRSITISGDAVTFTYLTELITAGAVEAEDKTFFGTAAPTGTVTGAAAVTLTDMSSEASFRWWKGRLSGGQATTDEEGNEIARKLIFAGVEMESLNASLENFDVLAVQSSEYTGDASDVGLSGFGGATEIQVAEGSRLTLLAAADGETVYGATDEGEELVWKNDGTIALQRGVTLLMDTAYSAQNGSAWEVNGGELILGENVEGAHHISVTDGGVVNVNGGGSEYSVEMSDASQLNVNGGEAEYTVEMSGGSQLSVNESRGNYKVSSKDADNAVIISDDIEGKFELDMGNSSLLELGDHTHLDGSVAKMGRDSAVVVGAGSVGDWTVEMGEDSSLTVGENAQDDWTVEMGEDSSLTVGENAQGDWTVEMGEGGSLTVGENAQGNWTVEMAEGGSLTVGDHAQGDYSVTLGTNSSMIVGAGASGNYDITLTGDAELDTYGSSITGVVVLNGAGVYDMKGGLAADLKLTLTEVTSESHVVNMGSGDVTLSGANRIVLSSSMQTAENAPLDTTGKLLLDKDATLTIDVNGIAADVQKLRTGVYYLTQGDLSDLSSEAAAGKLLFDATSLVLYWEISYREDGAICFFVPSKTDGHNIYQSNIHNQGAEWGRETGKSVYESVNGYEAVLISEQTELTLTKDDVLSDINKEGLVLRNLVGTKGGSLTVSNESGERTKLTLMNQIGEDQLAYLEELSGAKIENSLTFDGNLTLYNLGLQLKHVNPDKGMAGAPESTTIINGNLVVTGDQEVEFTSGVLRLNGANNDFGSGQISFAGTDAQLVISGSAAKAVVGGTVSVNAGAGLMSGERDHISLENGGSLELRDGAALGAGLSIASVGDSVGTLAVRNAEAVVSKEVRLNNVLLDIGSHSTLQIGSVSAVSRAASNEPEWMLSGLEGSGSLESQGQEMIQFTVAGGDHDFRGRLDAFHGTMIFNSSENVQSFTGVSGSENWSIVGKTGAHVVLNAYASGNSMTLGSVKLERNSDTCIFFDFTEMGEGSGLHVQKMDLAVGALVQVGQYGSGTITLGGDDGEEVSIAIVHVKDADSFNESKLDSWTLLDQNIRNASDVRFSYRDGVVYLTTVIDQSLGVYMDCATSENSMAGASILWGLGNSANLGGDLSKVDLTVNNLVHKAQEGDAASLAEVNHIMAAVAGSSTAVLGMALSGDVERQLRAIRNRTTAINHVGAPGEALSDVWINAEGDYHRQNADGLLPGYKVNGWGGTVGASHSIGIGKEIGLALTAMYSDVESSGADRLKADMDSYYVSAFAQIMHGAWRHTLVATYGVSGIDANRTVSYSGDSYTTKGSTDGTSLGALYEVGYSIPLRADSSVCLQPVANVALRHTRLDGYSESGSNAALNVGAQKSTVVTFGFGARVQAAVDGNLWNRASFFEGRALVKVDCGDRDSQADVRFNGTAAGKVAGKVHSAERGSVGVELGGGLTVPVSRMGQMFIDCSAELWQNYVNLNAAVGYKMDF